MSAMIRAAYERVSTEEQAEEGHSIQVQKEAIGRYLKTNGDQLYRHLSRSGFRRIGRAFSAASRSAGLGKRAEAKI